MRRRRAVADGTFQLHPRDLLTGDGDLFAMHTDGSATIDGEQMTWSTIGLYRLAGDRVARCWLLPLDQGHLRPGLEAQMTRVTLAALAAAMRTNWSSDTCDPVDLAAWSPARPSTGQCALIVQEHLGGELLLAEVHHADGRRQGVHYWIRLPDGRHVDLTREQFQAGEVIGRPQVEARPADTSRGRLSEQYARLRTAVNDRLKLTAS